MTGEALIYQLKINSLLLSLYSHFALPSLFIHSPFALPLPLIPLSPSLSPPPSFAFLLLEVLAELRERGPLRRVEADVLAVADDLGVDLVRLNLVVPLVGLHRLDELALELARKLRRELLRVLVVLLEVLRVELGGHVRIQTVLVLALLAAYLAVELELTEFLHDACTIHSTILLALRKIDLYLAFP